MKIIEQSFQIIDEYEKRGAILEQIERCGRICYKSEDRISSGSAEKFITGIIERGHESVLEMAQLVFEIVLDAETPMVKFFEIIPSFCRSSRLDRKRFILSGNPRVFRDLARAYGNLKVVKAILGLLTDRYPVLFSDIAFGGGRRSRWMPQTGISVRLMTPDEISSLPQDILIRHKTILIHLVTNRAVSHELVRHRVASYLQESQRYCRYGEARFGGELVFIRPCFYEEGTREYEIWLKAMAEGERSYLELLKTSSPQAARTVLPNSCKTEIMVHAAIDEWMHITRLRASKAADPSMREIMLKILSELVCRYPDIFGLIAQGLGL
ncbi:MAG: FAD-dependent thymidylate synthase [Dissulfurimicrobium sp.]|uniref:FAD-dependent thymidylate synthase n=1 Tax=Dissulfurimicrobium TaxID=1769732 RepID=UPI001EDA6CED|nr:FAD-dependent thymidylate synthase [Dissulfurimicrobium hydrothermale]UKL13977.1 FAD-dependent thymidylate synthase [Dissulfurimicrobium hydrothermale]